MAPLQNPPFLYQLQSATTYTDRATALRALKNDVVGHFQKKEAWVKLGALEPVVKVLVSSRSHPTKQLNGKDSQHGRFHNGALGEDEAVRLHALQLLSSFASAGPPFLAPLYAAAALPAILFNLSPYSNPPALVLASLKALSIFADAAALTRASSSRDTQVLSDSLFTPQHIDSLHAILSTSSPSPTSQSQIAVAADLISKLCTEEAYRRALAKPNGVLDALAVRLASFAVAAGQVIPSTPRQDGMAGPIPEPAPKNAKLGPILEAIATVVADSRYRAFMLLTSPAILAVFPTASFTPSSTVGSTWRAIGPNGMSLYSHKSLSAMDFLLPAVPPYRSSKRQRKKSDETRERKSLWGNSAHESPRFEPFGVPQDAHVADADRPESPLIPWLILLSRSGDDVDRLMAMAVLTPLFRADFASKGMREASLGRLVIPTLIRLLADNLADAQRQDSLPVDARTAANWKVLEKAPVLLARLVTDNEALQQAAFDCNVAETLSKLLQESYKSTTSTRPPLWSANPDEGMEDACSSATSTLGQQGDLPLLVHRIRVRENALKAIAATSGQDEHNKAYVDLDVLPCIVESLSEFPGKPLNLKERPKVDKPFDEPAATEPQPGYGRNPRSVIIAACHTIRMFSRSVGILRTSLVDYGVFGPIFRFLRDADIDVQIVATAVTANLVLNVSPMREPLIEQGVMKILCHHAHSLNASLRLNALWALKHLVYAVGVPLKKQCVEELSPGWLVRLICDDTEDGALVTARASMEKGSDYGGHDMMDEDVDMQRMDEVGRMGGEARDGGHGRPAEMEAKLAMFRESECNPVRKARNDDLAIQEQGLHFIRNLIMGSRSDTGRSLQTETTEMIDFLFTELSQDRLFEILASKLRVKTLRPLCRRSTSSRESGPAAISTSRMLYPQSKIIEAVIYILVHMAASAPRYRQVVIAQTELLKLLLPHFARQDKEVRLALCHLASNLTWPDPSDQGTAVAKRAEELRNLGFAARLEALAADDAELDVRERAKAALFTVRQTS